MQVRGRGERDLDHLALGISDRGHVVVVRQGVRYVARGHAVGLKLRGIEPRPQRERLPAEDLGRLHTLQRLELRLDDARQIIGDLIGGEDVAGEAHVHRIDGLSHLDRDDRLQRSCRQLVQHRLDLDVDFRRGLRRVVVLAQIHRDRAGAALAGRLHIVDAVGLRDGGLHRRGDEPGDRVGVGAREAGADGDHAVLGLGVGEHLERTERAQPDDEDDQAHHRGKHRAADENVGELHGGEGGYSLGGVGWMSSVGCTVLLTMTVEPLRSLICPADTTTSPSLTPARRAT